MLLASLLVFVAPVPVVADLDWGTAGSWKIRKRDGACYMFDGTNTSEVVVVTETLTGRQLTVEFLGGDWSFREEPARFTGYRLVVHGQNGRQNPWNGVTGVHSQHKGGGGSIAIAFEAEPSKVLQKQLAGASRLVLSWSAKTVPERIVSDHPVADMAAAIKQLDDCARWFS